MAASTSGRAGGANAEDDAEAGTPRRREPSEFGRLLKDLRVERHLSQAAVAQLAGVSPGYVGLIETGDRGVRPSLDIVKRFAQAVKATVPQMEELLRTTGHLGPDESLLPVQRPSFAAFVDADPRLSRRQKELLKGVYDSWLGPGPIAPEGH